VTSSNTTMFASHVEFKFKFTATTCVVGEFYFCFSEVILYLICVGGLCTFISSKGLCGGYVVFKRQTPSD
jgi:hypothetical protein